jgi:hypothetical protein
MVTAMAAMKFMALGQFSLRFRLKKRQLLRS